MYALCVLKQCYDYFSLENVHVHELYKIVCYYENNLLGMQDIMMYPILPPVATLVCN